MASAHAPRLPGWLYRVQHLNGTLLAVGENGVIISSTDSVNWTRQNSGVTAWLTDATFLDGAWFVVGTGGTVLTSTNLTAWNNVGTLTGKSLFGVATDGVQHLTLIRRGAALTLGRANLPARAPGMACPFAAGRGRGLKAVLRITNVSLSC